MRGVLRFTWWSLRAQRERLGVLCLGLCAIAICTTLLAGFTQLSRLTADRAVSRAWRTTYDLLVRAPDALSPVERLAGLVDPAGPEQVYGGISLAQVSQIAHIPHIALAAPEAIIGWVSLHPFVPLTLTQPGLYRVTTRLTDGTQTQQDVTNYAAIPLPQFTAATTVTSVATAIIPLPLNATGQAHIAASWTLPVQLAGIDPAAEHQLIGLSWQPSSAPAAPTGGLPLLMDTHAWGHLDATLRVERAPLPSLLTGGQPISGDTVAGADWATLVQRQLTAPDLLALLASELRFPSATAPPQGGGVTRLGRLAYALAPRSDTHGGPPVLQLTSPGADAAGQLLRLPLLPGTLAPWFGVGGAGGTFATFDSSSLAGVQAARADAAPLGLYRPEPQGVAPGLIPQRNPSTWPPLLFTTLSAACALTGARCVSAVRVRVAGLGTFGPRGEALLQQVAASIEQRTGLHVDVLAGASGIGMPVGMPPDAAGAGAGLTEIWDQPHAAVAITSGVNVANVLLLLAALCVAGLALVAAALLAAGQRRADLLLLTSTGWTSAHVLVETALEAVVSGVIAAVPALAVVDLLHLIMGGASAPPSIVAGILLLALALYVVVVTLAAHRYTGAAQSRPRASGHTRRSRWVWARQPWWWALLRRELARRPGAAALLILATGGASGLTLLLGLVSWGLDGVLYATLLGREVQVGLGGLHGIVAALTCASAALVAGLVLLLTMRERRGEFGLLLAVGWTPRALGWHVLRGALVLGALGGACGGCLAVMIFVALYQTWTPLLPVCLLAAMVLGSLLAGLGAAYPVRLAASLPIVRVLTDE